MTLARLAASISPLIFQRGSLVVRRCNSSFAFKNDRERSPGVLAGRPRPSGSVTERDDTVVDAFPTEDTNLGHAYVDDALIGTAGEQTFSPETQAILRAPISEYPLQFFPEKKVPYVPEIAFRQVLCKAFGVGGWALLPASKARIRTEEDGNRYVFREYVLYAHGKYIAHATGKCQGIDAIGLENALEAVKGQALKRCCKDLGMASEVWDANWRKSWEQQ